MGDGVDEDDDGGDCGGHGDLYGEYYVDLPDERPPELRALHHRRVQRLRPRFHISLPVRTIPHLFLDRSIEIYGEFRVRVRVSNLRSGRELGKKKKKNGERVSRYLERKKSTPTQLAVTVTRGGM